MRQSVDVLGSFVPSLSLNGSSFVIHPSMSSMSLNHNHLRSNSFRRKYLVRFAKLVRQGGSYLLHKERWAFMTPVPSRLHLSHLSLSADQHCERRWQTLLLSTLHLCCGHREHPTGVQRLPGHHPENAPAAVRTLVMGDVSVRRPCVFLHRSTSLRNFSSSSSSCSSTPLQPLTAPPVKDYEVLLKCVKSS